MPFFFIYSAQYIVESVTENPRFKVDTYGVPVGPLDMIIEPANVLLLKTYLV